MTNPRPFFSGPTIRVEAWTDPVIDRMGIDPRGHYAERFWLPLLGPSALWLLRRLVDSLEAEPDGFSFDTAELSVALGLSAQMHKHGPFMRTLGRVCQFKLARATTPSSIEVRRLVPPLTRGQALRLPPSAQRDHAQWLQRRLEQRHDDDGRRRARALALSLAQLGEDRDATERQLHRWRIDPALAAEAVDWAWQQAGGPVGVGAPDGPTAA